ncbi:hypothetical protein GCM10007242_28240 [Pigmentiphaga litoralis]|uniref:DUF2474 domain-containing protein n=1 Tax=Pigmentiphaga litoralis TaxID=516702 RepID=UPI001677BF40|nr:DUF2474 domain-containing protein [Pigmentiphaga litoralis]GGX19686.1 hypothetical protein GCM10007242_28240 [Pigmentiphaga litoralis]
MKWPALRWPAIEAPQSDRPLPPWRIRLAWMAGIWAGSIGALLLVAWLIRLVLKT